MLAFIVSCSCEPCCKFSCSLFILSWESLNWNLPLPWFFTKKYLILLCYRNESGHFTSVNYLYPCGPSCEFLYGLCSNPKIWSEVWFIFVFLLLPWNTWSFHVLLHFLFRHYFCKPGQSTFWSWSLSIRRHSVIFSQNFSEIYTNYSTLE
jgi:hypothetical protein